MGKSTISMVIFNSYVSHYQRVTFFFLQCPAVPSSAQFCFCTSTELKATFPVCGCALPMNQMIRIKPRPHHQSIATGHCSIASVRTKNYAYVISRTNALMSLLLACSPISGEMYSRFWLLVPSSPLLRS